MDRTFLLLGALAGFIGVALGAFGAHGLRTRLSAEMLAVFEEAADAFRCQTAAECEDEKVVRHFADHIAPGESNVAFVQMNPRNFAFYETDFPIQHRLTQIESNVVRFGFAEGEPDQCRVEDELVRTRGERNLVITSECLRQGLCCNHARKATADN